MNMNPAPDPPAEVRALCDEILDGTLSETGRRRLEELVVQNPAARRAYVEYLHLHSALKEARLKDGTLAEAVNIRDFTALHQRPGHPWRQPLLAAAAAVVVLAAGWALGHLQGGAGDSGSPDAIARIVEAKGARWLAGNLPTEVGAALSTGRLRLAAGLATVEFGNGAQVTLEGPADLELLRRDLCFLHSGALTAHVPPEGVGFVVETTNARLVDHGTDFGISVAPDGGAQVQVFEGKVELQHHGSGDRLELVTKQGAKVTPDELGRSLRSEDETGRGVSRRHALSGENVVTLTTAHGSGRAGYAASPGTKEHFSDTLLLLKHSAQVPCRRKAWLGFDLAVLQGREIAEASLTLTFEPTGWGYASLLPDAVFAVYGITSDALDAWDDTHDLDWMTAPANDPDGVAGQPGHVVKLGTFTMPAGVLEGAFTLEGHELAAFLNADANRYATLMVVRETEETRGGGVVHGFAGNRHPTLRPPTLHLLLK